MEEDILMVIDRGADLSRFLQIITAKAPRFVQCSQPRLKRTQNL